MDQKADADLIRELYEMVTNLDVLQLSDGEKCTLALFGDIARRLAIANPSLDDPLQGDGVVLIDELELHMHTSWQRKVISMLKKTFPNIQFIITTHSPQILGEVDHDFNVYALSRNGSDIQVVQTTGMFGMDSNSILEDKMETANNLYKMGMPLEQIAQAVQVSVQMIQEWLSGETSPVK